MKIYLLGTNNLTTPTNTEYHAIELGLPSKSFIACKSNQEAIETMLNTPGDQNYALVPYYNILGSSVQDTMKTLSNNEMAIGNIFTTKMSIAYYLMAHVNTRIRDITHIGSHPQALYQTRVNVKKFFARNLIEVDTQSTANSISWLQQSKNSHILSGVIAPFQYHEGIHHDIQILQDNFGPENNYTHFALLGKQGYTSAPSIDKSYESHDIQYKKLSIQDYPGSLASSLDSLVEQGIDVRGITSLPQTNDTTDFIITFKRGMIIGDMPVLSSKEWEMNIESISGDGKEALGVLRITPEFGSLRKVMHFFANKLFDIREIHSLPIGYELIDFRIRLRYLGSGQLLESWHGIDHDLKHSG